MAIRHFNGYMKGMKLDEPVDVLHDRAGYSLVVKPERSPGECWFSGVFDVDPTAFTIIHYDTYQAFLDEQFDKDGVDDNNINISVPQKKLDVVEMEKKTLVDDTTNMYAAKDVVTKTGTPEDKQQWDTFYADPVLHQTIYTIGTAGGEDYSTISAFISAAAEGDCGTCHDANFTEVINLGSKTLQLVGVIADQGVTLTHSSGTFVINSSNPYGSLIKNFTVDGNSVASYGVIVAGMGMAISECISHSSTKGFYGTAGQFINCIAYNNTDGFHVTGTIATSVFCTAAHNSGNGFTGAGATQFSGFACLASDNGTDFANASNEKCAWNTSKDGTAPGHYPSINTFVNTDYVNDAARDQHLKTTVAGTTAARREGYPVEGFGLDIARQVRKQTAAPNIFFGGASDADPIPSGGGGGPTVHLIQGDADGVTVEVSAGVLQVKDDGIDVNKLAHAIDATGIGFDADKVDGQEAAIFAEKVDNSDIEITDATKGYILRDTQGTPHKWRITIDNTGNLISTDLGAA